MKVWLVVQASCSPERRFLDTDAIRYLAEASDYINRQKLHYFEAIFTIKYIRGIYSRGSDQSVRLIYAIKNVQKSWKGQVADEAR